MLEIKTENIKNIKKHKNNPRKHTDKQVDQIAKSIKEFGFTNPILIDENKTIIAGHGRYMAAKKNNLVEIPTITLKNLTEDQIKALMIADNKLGMNSTWDEDLLWKQIEELNNGTFDIELLGFDKEQIIPFVQDEALINDVLAEWEGMPEFVSEDKTAYRSVIVHFENEDDVVAFQMKLEQSFSEKAKYIWYPHKENMDTESKRYE